MYLFLHRLDRFLAEAIRQTIADELESSYTGVGQPSAKPFAEKFLDCPFSAIARDRSLKEEILHRLVEPLVAARGDLASGQRLPKNVKVSAILFGPPGTSKTEIVEQIADFVGWPAVTVDPSYFVKNGLDAIQAQANRIFRMLASAEQMVVLFDEFDEMVRNRAESEDVLSRFLTTAMLPKLAKINKERRILFIVATNFIRSFDIAISRPGRFDLILQMMPPKAERKLEKEAWASELGWMGSISDDASFMGELEALTYAETEKVVARLGAELNDDHAQRDAQYAREIWRAAVDGGTLAKPHEQRKRLAGEAAEGLPAPVAERLAQLAGRCATLSPEMYTWAEVAVLETVNIRSE